MRHTIFGFPRLISLPLLLLVLGLAASSPALGQAARISGKATGEDGQPLPGVVLRLVAQDEDGKTVEGVQSNKKGKFAVPNLRTGTYLIELETPGYRVARVELEVRTSDGRRAAEFEEDVLPGLLPTPFIAGLAQRIELALVLAETAEEEQGTQQTLSAALGESAKLNELNVLFEQNQMDQLAEQAAELVREKPDLGGAWYLLAVGQWQTDQYEAAVQSFRKALELVPDQPGVKGALGSALLDHGDRLAEQGDEEAARAAWAEAIDLLDAQCGETPGDKTFVTNRIVVLERLGRVEELPAAINALLALEPGEIRAYLRLAELHVEAGQRDEALAVLDSIPEQGHDAAVAMYNIAVEMYNESEYDAMILVLEKALAIEPEAPEYHRLLGRAYLSKGEDAKAIEELSEFLRLAPDDPGAEVEQALVDALQKN